MSCCVVVHLPSSNSSRFFILSIPTVLGCESHLAKLGVETGSFEPRRNSIIWLAVLYGLQFYLVFSIVWLAVLYGWQYGGLAKPSRFGLESKQPDGQFIRLAGAAPAHQRYPCIQKKILGRLNHGCQDMMQGHPPANNRNSFQNFGTPPLVATLTVK